MAPKKSSLRTLTKKGVSTKKAAAVKGGLKNREPRISGNHNQVLRSR